MGEANDAFTKCGETFLVGGYNKFGAKATATREFKVPPHGKLRVQVVFYKIDSWDNEWFYLTVDNKRVFEKQIGFSTPQ